MSPIQGKCRPRGKWLHTDGIFAHGIERWSLPLGCVTVRSGRPIISKTAALPSADKNGTQATMEIQVTKLVPEASMPRVVVILIMHQIRMFAKAWRQLYSRAQRQHGEIKGCPAQLLQGLADETMCPAWACGDLAWSRGQLVGTSHQRASYQHWADRRKEVRLGWCLFHRLNPGSTAVAPAPGRYKTNLWDFLASGMCFQMLTVMETVCLVCCPALSF